MGCVKLESDLHRCFGLQPASLQAFEDCLDRRRSPELDYIHLHLLVHHPKNACTGNSLHLQRSKLCQLREQLGSQPQQSHQMLAKLRKRLQLNLHRWLIGSRLQ